MDLNTNAQEILNGVLQLTTDKKEVPINQAVERISSWLIDFINQMERVKLGMPNKYSYGSKKRSRMESYAARPPDTAKARAPKKKG